MMKHHRKIGWVLLFGVLCALGFVVDWAKDLVAKQIKGASPEPKDDR